jgi:hypothetical protein
VFTGEQTYVFTSEELTPANMTAGNVRIFRIDAAGNIVNGGRIISQNADGSVTVGITENSQHILIREVRRGNVFGNGNRPSVNDALQILRSLVRLSNVIDNNAIALNAANITRQGQSGVNRATVNDALQILRNLVRLSSSLDDVWPRR